MIGKRRLRSKATNGAANDRSVSKTFIAHKGQPGCQRLSSLFALVA
jgi:hypothetical protein